MRKVRGLRRTILLLVAFATLTVPVTALAGSLQPSAAPAPTMRTLEELKPAWDQIIPASQRFVNALDGTAVLDKETGLVWAKTPDATLRTWQTALDYCAGLTLGGRMGWRLPSIEELGTLIDPTAGGSPKLPAGNPFLNVQAGSYWSSSTNVAAASYARILNMATGGAGSDAQTNTHYVWPVRAGQ